MMPRWPDVLQLALALFAAAWAVTRARVQSMTGDEAETYLFFAARHDLSQWAPAANNHLLNSLLIRWFTSVFGPSNLSIRGPALIGAVLYIAASFYFSRLISREWIVRIPLFVSLVYNPFMFDFFVAARGYGLATAFLVWAILLPARRFARTPADGEPPLATYAASSVLLALSFTASYVYAVVDAVALTALLLWGAARMRHAAASVRSARPYLRLLAAAIGPGLIIFLLLPSWTVLHFPKTQLWDGARSIPEMLTTVANASRYEPNPDLLNPFLYPIVVKSCKYLIPSLIALSFLQASLLIGSGSWARIGGAPWSAAFGALVLGIVSATLLGHWILLAVFHILLPRNRTALFLVPLLTMWVGTVASIRSAARFTIPGRRLLTAVLFASSLFFLTCLRLNYFQEWQYQQDLKQVYGVMTCYARSNSVRDVEVSWYYSGALSYYRALFGRDYFAPFTTALQHPAGKQLYILNAAFEGEFIDKQHLSVLYRGPTTDVVVAAPPELTQAYQSSCATQRSPQE